MIAYLRGEDGSGVVEAALYDPEPCLAHAINICEVYYDFLRDSGQAQADKAITDLLTAGLIERQDIDQEFWKKLGYIKAFNRISLADCFALALASRCETALLSSDHHEFDPLVDQGICQISFIR